MQVPSSTFEDALTPTDRVVVIGGGLTSGHLVTVLAKAGVQCVATRTLFFHLCAACSALYVACPSVCPPVESKVVPRVPQCCAHFFISVLLCVSVRFFSVLFCAVLTPNLPHNALLGAHFRDIKLVLRGPRKIKQFDLTLPWFGDDRWKKRHQFETAAIPEKLEAIKGDRDGGSFTPERQMQYIRCQSQIGYHR